MSLSSRCTCALLLALQVSVFAGQLPEEHGIQLFRSGTVMMVRTVSVTNGDGMPIEGLTTHDFAVTEDGDPQEIAFVEFHRLSSGVPVPRASVSSSIPAPATREVREPPNRPGLSPAGAAPRPRRFVVLYFDLSALLPMDGLRAYRGALTFLEQHMEPPDLVALMTFQRGVVRLRQDFTDDRERLRREIETLIHGDRGRGVESFDTAPGLGVFGQNDVEFNLFNTNRQLSALQTAVTMLAERARRTTLVYFGSGLAINGSANQAQFRATANAAVLANVTINPVDARGLVALAPLGDAGTPSPGGEALFSGLSAATSLRNFRRSQDVLHALAEETGGTARFDDNDLGPAIARVTQGVVSYYVLAYYSTHTERDGRARRVRIALKRDLAAELDYQQVYFGEKSFANFTDADRERQLEEALMSANPVTDLTMALELNYFQLNSAEYYVSVFIKFRGGEFEFTRRGRSRLELDVLAEVRTAHGVTIQNLRDKLDVKLPDDTASRLAAQPLLYETGFTLLPDDYVIRIVARDAVTGVLGTYETAFTVPNLEREERLVPLSSVVLGSQESWLGDELHRVGPGSQWNASPLVHDGRKVIPSVTRVFRGARDLHVLLEAHRRRSGNETGPLAAFVALYRDDKVVLETMPLIVTRGTERRPWVLPLHFEVPLDTLPSGRFRCQVTVLDPMGQKVAFWQAPIIVVQ